MPKKPKTAREEYEFYEDPRNLEPQGPPQRRKPRLTELVPVRFAPDVLDEIRRYAEAEDRSASSWIRRAVDNEITRRKRKT